MLGGVVGRHVCPECGRIEAAAGACPDDRTTLVAAGDDALLGATVGKYRIAALIGAGGMGRVYKAVQPDIGARVAVKLLKREYAEDAELVDRFFAEARAVNVIRHEGIVTALIGATLGIGLGIALAALVTAALSSEGLVFSVPVISLIVFVIIAIVAGMLAAIFPARRAARLNVLQALQYE